MIREKHGIVAAKKIAAVNGDIQDVTVIDGDSIVKLALSTSNFPAGLTPEQARFISRALLASANRVEAKSK